MILSKRPATLAILLLLAALSLQSQAAVGGSNLVFYGLAALALIIFLFIVVSVSDNFMAIEQKQAGITDANLAMFPRLGEIFRKKTPEYLDEAHVYTLKAGYDVPVEGDPVATVIDAPGVNRYAIRPPDFRGPAPIPRVTVEVGDQVRAGDVVFHDKKQDRIKYCAPVSGEVIEVNRGLKRSIASIVILADKEQQSRDYELPAATATRGELVDFLLESGVWPSIRQRPYNVVADPDLVPRDIFVSTFSTSPLAPNLALSVLGREDDFQAGLDVLNRLTDGLVYLGLDGNGETASRFAAFRGVQQRYFRGKHPAGNVGTQIHHIHAAGAGDNTVWTLDVAGVLSLGKLFRTGVYDSSRVVALGGYSLANPIHVRTHAGANLGELLANQGVSDNDRVISGDVLSGTNVGHEGYLGYFDDQVSVIREGNEAEIFGWLLPIKPRASVSPTIPVLSSEVEVTTNSHGERRAFVVNNDYEQVFPFDIYLQQLMKSIIVNDFENMEGLGIYELVEEDVALAEFACVSKQPLQQILRSGLDTMREQG